MKVAQLCLSLCDLMGYTVHGILQTRILERVAIPFSRGSSSQPIDRTRSPSLQVGSLPAEPPGKPKNTGVGSLSLLQWIKPGSFCITGRFFTSWATREAPSFLNNSHPNSCEFSFAFTDGKEPGGSDGKASVYKAGDLGLIPGLGRFPGEGNSNPLQYSCLGNPMDRGAWWTTVHGVTKSGTQLSDFTLLHFNSCGTTSHCGFDFISWMTNELSTFSYTYWPFVCLLWKMSIQGHCLFF